MTRAQTQPLLGPERISEKSKSKAVAGAAELLFGFTGLGRVYLESYPLGITKLALCLFVLIGWSVNDARAFSSLAEEARAEALLKFTRMRFLATFALVVLTVLDLSSFATTTLTESPERTLYNSRYRWSLAANDERLATGIAMLIAFAVPFAVVNWLFNTA